MVTAVVATAKAAAIATAAGGDCGDGDGGSGSNGIGWDGEMSRRGGKTDRPSENLGGIQYCCMYLHTVSV